MLTLAELRQCRVAAQTAILFLEQNGGATERIATFQKLIARVDEEIGDTSEKTGFDI